MTYLYRGGNPADYVLPQPIKIGNKATRAAHYKRLAKKRQNVRARRKK